ncbi:MAG: response regulator [Acidobacteriia bacterium]|nr:response regulator [Terriglobia bacterium]
MSAPMGGLPISPALSRKRVLLVDTSSTKRDLRADAMRKLGVDVDCAADINEARSWWRADLYHLVLINMGNGLGHRDRFCEDIRGATPPQQLAFLVGKPEYLADSPGTEDAGFVPGNGVDVPQDDRKPTVPVEFGGEPRRWGILEASQRISAVRSAATARSNAMRDRPVPPRDFETRDLKRSGAWSQMLPELQKKELE